MFFEFNLPGLHSVIGHKTNQNYATLFELATPVEKHQFFEMDQK